jgi:hypothetical protein
MLDLPNVFLDDRQASKLKFTPARETSFGVFLERVKSTRSLRCTERMMMVSLQRIIMEPSIRR